MSITILKPAADNLLGDMISHTHPEVIDVYNVVTNLSGSTFVDIVNTQSISGNKTFENIVTQHGTDNSTDGGFNIQNNGFRSNSNIDCDASFNLAVSGVDKWSMETYRGENGEFYYLYNPEAQIVPLTVSDGGRFGINKPTNIVNYHTRYMYPASGLLNDMDAGGVYNRTFNTLYSISISTTGNPDMFTYKTSLDNGDTWSSDSSPANCSTSAISIETYGVTVLFENLTGHNTYDSWQFTAHTQLPEGALTVRPQMFTEVNTTTDYTPASPEWNDITYDCASLNGNLNTLLPIGDGNTVKGAVYFGNTRKWNSAFFDIRTAAVGANVIFEYWDGLQWSQITGVHGFSDNTNGLVKSGSIQWDRKLLTGWSKKLLDGKDPSDTSYILYWVRIRSIAVMSVEPTVHIVTPQGNKRFAVYAGYLDNKESFMVDGLGSMYINKEPGFGTALTVQNIENINYKATVNVEESDTSYNIYKVQADDNHRMFFGYGHLDFWTSGNPAIFRHKFDQGYNFYNNMTDNLFNIESDGTLSVGTAGYETMVLGDNDIPNRKWVIDNTGGGLTIQGYWNAATNTPDISGTTVPGYFWVTSVSGTTDLGGITSWAVNDWAVKTLSGWINFNPGTTTWGSIVGTLSAQSDLWVALNDKVSDAELAAWTGSSNITTVGTIGAGTWNGNRIDSNYLDADVTLQGNTFNGVSQLVQTTVAGHYPALSGDLIIAPIVPGSNNQMASKAYVDSRTPSTAYTTTFTNSSLTSGILTVTHNLGQKIVNPVVADNNDKVILPDDIIFTDTTKCNIDLSSYGTLNGTWTTNVIKAGGSGTGGSGGGMTWEILETSGNAVNGHGYFIDATSRSIDLTLPSSPSINNIVGVRVLDISNTVTILRNGENIEKIASDLIINVAGTGITLGYTNSTYGWVVINN